MALFIGGKISINKLEFLPSFIQKLQLGDGDG
jgi:hypothetical protein